MPRLSVHEQTMRTYVFYMILRDLFTPAMDLEDLCRQHDIDMRAIHAIKHTRYLRGRSPVLKLGNLSLAWEFAQSPSDHKRFVNMLRVSPEVFDTLLCLINDHPIFYNNSNNPQTDIQTQLAVTLYRMGRYGNGASLEDLARDAGHSEGSIENFTYRCFTAIEALHDVFVRRLTAEEKEVEKRWMDDHLGFVGTWREGWIMYDGTIVVLYKRPGLDGDAYYTRKSNYGLNAQVGDQDSQYVEYLS